MLRRFWVIAASCLALGGLILVPAEVLAFRGGGGGFGGMRGGGGFGGMHSFGGMHGFGGMHSFGGIRSFGGTHFGRSFGGHHAFARGHVTHFARSSHFHTRTATGRHFTNHHFAQNRVAGNRLAAQRFARNARANRLANLAGHNANLRATRANFRGRNAFANAKWGGHDWRHRGFRRFWAGGVFWPYFFGDYFSYAFWPYDYWDGFWGWGPDVLLWSAFWPYYDYPYSDYGYYSAAYPAPVYSGDIYSAYRHAYLRPERYAGITPQEAAATCAGIAPGVGGLPFQRIAAIIEPAPDQQQAFDELKAAMTKASQILSGACPGETPATPVARLDAMEQRLQAMLQAEEIVRDPLERLYSLLSQAQKRRLDATAAAGGRPANGRPNLAKLCSSEAGFAKVPAEDIARTISLSSQQSDDLDALTRASDKAADMLRDACPATVPETLSARLDAADARLRALIQAIEMVRPEVRTFFASLTPVQQTALNSEAPRVRTASRRR